MGANKDGRVSREEAKGPLAERVDEIDTNKDGFLDREELRRAMIARLKAGGLGGGGAPSKPGGLTFEDLDKNADGRLTKEEVAGTPLAEHFDEIDTNKDGK